MKITRYFQSCLLVEDGKARILIDPSGDDVDNFASFGKLDAVFYTHEHADHFDPELADKFMAAGVTTYANASTAQKMKYKPEVVTDAQPFEVNGAKIKVIELPHCLMPNGSEGPQNSGYLINEKLFIPGDGKELDDLSVEILALPITGPDVSMKDAFAFAKQVNAKEVVPIHYDKIGANPEVYATFAGYFPDDFTFKFHVLKQGESVEV